MGDLQFVPWLLAVVTGAVFGWMGYRSVRGWAPWAIGGLLCALVVSTIIIGLFRAAFIPLSESADASMDFKAVALSVLLIVGLGALFTYRMWPAAFSIQLPRSGTTSGVTEPSGGVKK